MITIWFVTCVLGHVHKLVEHSQVNRCDVCFIKEAGVIGYTLICIGSTVQKNMEFNIFMLERVTEQLQDICSIAGEPRSSFAYIHMEMNGL